MMKITVIKKASADFDRVHNLPVEVVCKPYIYEGLAYITYTNGVEEIINIDCIETIIIQNEVIQ